MSKGMVETIIGGYLLAASIVFDIITAGAATPLTVAIMGFLISAGAGLMMSGIGTMIGGTGAGGGGGVTAASRNPVKSWDGIYGRARGGGQIVFVEDHGGASK